MNNSEYIAKRSLSSFVNGLTEEMRLEFYRMIGPVEIYQEQIFEPYKSEVRKNKAFLGKFHQLFVQKVICNLQNKDWYYSKSIFKFASIFPFEIKPHIEEEIDLKIFQALDSNFEKDVEEFLKMHFDNVDQQLTAELVKIFFKNIFLFRKSSNNTQDECASTLPEARSSNHVAVRILDNIPQFTENGIACYLRQYQLTQEVMKKFSPAQEEAIHFGEYDKCYFLKLPETNFEELFSLLDVNFYRQNSTRYKKLFEKYIFFFKHALCLGYTPLCFIDDLLFECLKGFHSFVKSREDPIHLKSQIANLTCIYQRADIDLVRDLDLAVSDESLNDIKRFFETGIRNVNSTVLHYSIENAPMKNHVFACTDREIFDVCFSWKLKKDVSHFIKYIILSAFSPKKFNRLCIYNMYTGVKTWMYIYTPSYDRKKIKRFVDEYYNETVENLYPQDFITRGFEEYCKVYRASH